MQMFYSIGLVISIIAALGLIAYGLYLDDVGVTVVGVLTVVVCAPACVWSFRKAREN